MNTMKIIYTSLCLLGLAGCANEPVTLAVNQSTVTLKAQLGDEMIARRLDDVQSNNLRQFVVETGEHKMEIGIVKKGYQESHRTCLATLSYKDFQPNQSYDLVERSSLGGGVTLALVDSNGSTLEQSDNVACL